MFQVSCYLPVNNSKFSKGLSDATKPFQMLHGTEPPNLPQPFASPYHLFGNVGGLAGLPAWNQGVSFSRG